MTTSSLRTTRRMFLTGAGSLFLAGCVAPQGPSFQPSLAQNLPMAPPAPPPPPVAPLMYQAMPNERFPIPAVDVSVVPERWWRTEVDYPTDERPGTLIVDTPNRYLYHVGTGGRATRYGVGIGRDGFAWAGRAHMAYKREWPRWTAPDSMVARDPGLAPYGIEAGGMAPGLGNPLGARALYIHQGNVDTLYRLHGTHEDHSIGTAASSGCIRMLNQDVIHLHDTARDGSPIVVIPDPTMSHLLV